MNDRGTSFENLEYCVGASVAGLTRGWRGPHIGSNFTLGAVCYLEFDNRIRVVDSSRINELVKIIEDALILSSSDYAFGFIGNRILISAHKQRDGQVTVLIRGKIYYLDDIANWSYECVADCLSLTWKPHNCKSPLRLLAEAAMDEAPATHDYF